MFIATHHVGCRSERYTSVLIGKYTYSCEPEPVFGESKISHDMFEHSELNRSTDLEAALPAIKLRGKLVG